MELREARRRAHINKSLNQIIIDAILAAPAPEPGQTNAPSANCCHPILVSSGYLVAAL